MPAVADAPQFTQVDPHPTCKRLAKKMLAKFKDLPAFDHAAVTLDLSTPDMDLTSYDWIVVNTSGGKDSMCICRQVVALATRQNVLDRVVFVHCDLKGMEWFATKELAKAHAAHYGVKFVVVSRPQGDLLYDIRQRGMWPGSKTRYCTSHHKRGQVLKLFTFLSKKTRTEKYVKQARILNIMGHRADESTERECLEPFNENFKPGQISNSRRHVDYWFPIHHWSKEKVWGDIKASGVPYHYAYDLGIPRLSCVFCVFSPKSALLIAGKYNPQLLDEYAKTEQASGHRFKMSLSIIDVQKQVLAGDVPKRSEDWVM